MKRYHYIRAWGEYMGSYEYHIHQQQQLAVDGNAPEDAIFRCQDGTWATRETCKNPSLLEWLDQRVQQLEAGTLRGTAR